MIQLANPCFNVCDKEFIGITRYGAIWTDSRQKYKLLYDETSLKLLITQYTVVALLSVAFAFVSGLQFLWDLTQPLLWQTYFCIIRKGSGFFEQKNSDSAKVWIFLNSFRFIDGLCSFNNTEFKNNYNEFYPDKLELKKGNEKPRKNLLCTFQIY